MKVNDSCIGCGSCIPYCPMEAISLIDNIAHINQDECVECNVCLRAKVCPVDALYQPELSWPRTLRRFFSDPGPKHMTGVPGRGTEEMKTNDVTGRYTVGEAGIAIDIGRPCLGTRLKDVEKIYKCILSLGVHFEEQNPLRSLIKDEASGDFKDEVLNEKVLSIIIEFKVPTAMVPAALKALEKAAGEIDTVFSVGLIDRVTPDGSMPNCEKALTLGYKPYPNAKINIGIGRPLADC